MNFTEFIIIYLSIGAPLAVYFFLQNRHRLKTRQLWLKTILNFVFWLPLAYRLFKNYLESRKTLKNDFDSFAETDSADKKLATLQREIENSFIESAPNLSLFEIREIFDRYAGLTLETNDSSNAKLQNEIEFFNISNKKDAETASMCNQRRNFKRLLFHQKLAANDFFDLISDLKSRSKISQRLYSQLLEFSIGLKDFQMQKEIEKMFDTEKQTSGKTIVKERENDLWKTDQPNSLKTAPLSMSFQSMNATTNLSTKD